MREYTLEELHNKIGYVPQKAVLFSGTVKSNIAFGENGKPEPDTASMAKAADIAQAADFIEKKQEKYDAPIAQNGTNLSGGQKQRMAIARAVCRQPEIFIFDDSFSALDYKTDSILRHRLAEETTNATTFIVAQRIGTIRHADQIIVLDEGHVAGIGTHDELMQNCKVYQEIAYSQLSKEELGNA